MLNGWFTIVAQAINFLILVWLLKRFLYKPILQAIDAREKGIAAQLASAVAKEATAQEQSDDFQRKNTAFDQERATLLSKATDEAKTERQRLIDDARKDANALRVSRQSALQAEQGRLNQEVRRWTQEQVFAIARKTLADLASPCLEARMSEVFVTRLRGLTGPAKDQLAVALKKSPASATVRSVIELPTAQRTEIESAINETFDSRIHVQFQTAPELVSGIELSSNGQKVAWSIADYLATLEKSAGELLKSDDKPPAKAEVKAMPAPQLPARARPVVQPAASAPKGRP